MLRHRSDSRVAMADSTGLVRRLSVLVESIHAVVYFAPEPQSAYAELGLRGYWRGYFASRAAPLGAAGPQLVTALFGGFARAMVTRSVPEVWAVASPQQVQAARLFGATAALRRLFNDDHLPTVAAAAALTSRRVHALPLPGRPMGPPRNPVWSARTSRWQRCGTTAPCCGSTGGTAIWRQSPWRDWCGPNRTCCRVRGLMRGSKSTGAGTTAPGSWRPNGCADAIRASWKRLPTSWPRRRTTP